MTHLTRDVLIKKIVADEMVGLGGTDYIKTKKDHHTNGNIKERMFYVKNIIR